VTSFPEKSEQPDDAWEREPLGELLRRAFDDDLSDEEFETLQASLRESPEARRSYLEYAAVHALLVQSFDAADGTRALASFSRRNELQPARSPAGVARHFWKTLIGVSVLSLALLAVGFWATRRPADRLPVEQPVVAWLDASDSPRALRAGDHVRQVPGRGAVRFENGVQLSLSESGDLEILSGTKVRLHHGQIQVDVGNSGRGFTVLTKSTEVVDLGTVFGVGVSSDGETDVVVFDGEVELDPLKKSRDQSQSFERNLNTGEALRIQSNGDRARIPMIWQNSTNSQWSANATSHHASVIASVRDNLSTEARPKFYAIVPKGFHEDAKVYVDRRYEWNSLTEAGLPSEVVGADYIRTFNSDKAQGDLQIIVALNGPADIYVLIDKRFPIPDWLAADFVQTGFDVGIDLGTGYGKGHEETPPLGMSVRRVLGKGPGKSVDVPVSIWKREVRESREIRFGPVPADTLPPGRGSMYGILAVPIGKTND
jgi:hypothetical protein